MAPRAEADQPPVGEDDPVLVTRSNPADADNWLTIQFKDRSNFYNDNVIPVFDQGMIDLYGRRDGETLPGNTFCNAQAAPIADQLFLQRRIYVRNTYRFKLGWQFALFEPMDVVLVTEPAAELYQQPVRSPHRGGSERRPDDRGRGDPGRRLGTAVFCPVGGGRFRRPDLYRRPAAAELAEGTFAVRLNLPALPASPEPMD